MFHVQTSRGSSCVILLVSTKRTPDSHSQVKSLTSQDVLANAPLTFTRKSTHLQDVLANAPLTFTHMSPRCCLHPIHEDSPLWHGSLFVVQPSCSCKLDTAVRYHASCCPGRPLWARICSWCSHPALVCLILLSGTTHPVEQDAHCGLGFAHSAVTLLLRA